MLYLSVGQLSVGQSVSAHRIRGNIDLRMPAILRFYTIRAHEATEEGGYWAEVLDLPGCASQGETMELEANLLEAIEAVTETPVHNVRLAITHHST